MGADENKANILIAHRNLLIVRPPVSAMAYNMLNTLDKVTTPRADRNVITRLRQPHGQRQRRTDKTGDENVNQEVA
jgi:hypothetical protein